MYNFDPFNALLAIATNILLLTGFVLQIYTKRPKKEHKQFSTQPTMPGLFESYNKKLNWSTQTDIFSQNPKFIFPRFS